MRIHKSTAGRGVNKLMTLMLTAIMLVPALPLQVLAYIPNGYDGAITWSGHGTLLGHYASAYSGENVYSRGMLCMEPEKGAMTTDNSYGTKISSGQDKTLARIGYLTNEYALGKNTALNYIASWAVGTGLVYDYVEGRNTWGTVTAVGNTEISINTYLEARDWIVERLENYDKLPAGVYATAAEAAAAPLDMVKQSDGSFKLTLRADAFWDTDIIYHGFQETAGASGTLTVGGASVGWSRTGSSITFTLSKAEAAKWNAYDGYSGAVTLTKRLGNGSVDCYPIWESAYEADQDMLYAPEACAAYGKGYLAFHVTVEPGYVHVTKTIASDKVLTDLCGAYSLEGTQISIYSDADDSLQAVLTIGADGTALSQALKQGSYYARETKAAPGFALDGTLHPFTLAPGENKELSFSNKPLFDPLTVILQKQGTVSGIPDQPIAGAEYTVYFFPQEGLSAAKAMEIKGSALRRWVLKTDAAGMIKLDGAHKTGGDDFFTDSKGSVVGLPGTYLYEETGAPEGYLPGAPFVKTISLTSPTLGEAGDFNAPVVKEQQASGYVYLTKAIGEGSHLTALCPTWFTTDGAEFTLFYPGTDKVASATDGTPAVLQVTGGKTPVLSVPQGEYDIKETKTPAHFAEDTKVYRIKVDASSTAQAPATLEITNDPLLDPVSLLLTKVGTVAGTAGQPLEGAVFKVSYFSAVFGEAEDVAGDPLRSWYFVTDEDGQLLYEEAYLAPGYASDPLFTLSDGTPVGLPGTYMLEEVKAPAGYLAADPCLLTVDPDLPGYGGSVSLIQAPTLEDQPLRYRAIVTKVDSETGEAKASGYADFEGSVFALLSYDPRREIYTELQTAVVDNSGQAEFLIPNPMAEEGNVPGILYVQEKVPGPGCTLNPQRFEVDLSLADGSEAEILFSLEVPEGYTRLEILKAGRDETGASVPLEGAELKLLDGEGNTIEVWTSDGTPKVFTGLPEGSYTLRETKAPEGYKLMEETIPLELTGEPLKFTLQNEPEEPEKPETPDKPEEPDTPREPEKPEIPEEPEKPADPIPATPGKEEPKIPETPDTGDNGSVWFYLGLSGLSLAAMISLSLYTLRKLRTESSRGQH
ncbi:MAG: hypothetical protein HUJ69_00565 [Lachnospiraceae bacterium]|nr:hypothetical protein [Lachnospiraceae bacterium]